MHEFALKDISLLATVGVDFWERKRPQPLNVDVSMMVHPIDKTDRNINELDLRDIPNILQDFIEENQFQNIGIAAFMTMQHLLEMRRIKESTIELCLTQPKALLLAKSVSATIKWNGVMQKLSKSETTICELCVPCMGLGLNDLNISRDVPIDIIIHTADFERQYADFRHIAQSVIGAAEAIKLSSIEDRLASTCNFILQFEHVDSVTARIYTSTDSSSVDGQFQVTKHSSNSPKLLPFYSLLASRIGLKHTRNYHGHVVYIAITSSSIQSINVAIKSVTARESCELLDSSFLYQSKAVPCNVEPLHLNAVIKISTNLSPEALNLHLTSTQSKLCGVGIISLKIILYDSIISLMTEPDTGVTFDIPCQTLHKDESILRPLCDIGARLVHPVFWSSMQHLLESLSGPSLMQRVTPIPNLDTSGTSVVDRFFKWGNKTYIVGVLNITPDSKTDGGKYIKVECALEKVRQLLCDGSDVIEIGGVSTRPGADFVSVEEEIRRILPVFECIRKDHELRSVILSVDTFRPEVVRAILPFGLNMINQIFGDYDSEIFKIAAETDIPICIMHTRGDPKTMQSLNTYDGDIMDCIISELGIRVEKAITSGVKPWNIIIDPGLGFAKVGPQNFDVIRQLNRLTNGKFSILRNFPIYAGPSRKRFLSEDYFEHPRIKQDMESAAACVCCIQSGADMLRIHNVKDIRDAVTASDYVYRRSATKDNNDKVL